VNNILTSICCSALFSFLSFNIFIPFERAFSQPLYALKSAFSKSSVLGEQAKPSSKYTIILAGDSMTQALGSGETISPTLRKYYPNKDLHILNYGIGSTSILTLPERLTKGAIRGNETLLPILDKDFDLILIESFGNNPLSNLPLEEGLKKQEEALNQSLKLIKEKKPKAVIIFVATIAPNKDRYAEGVTTLNPEQRKQWVDERVAYIKNHIKYAKDHKISLIDLFNKSLDKYTDYINDSDFIHPSNNGLIFIGEEIANFIVSKRILLL